MTAQPLTGTEEESPPAATARTDVGWWRRNSWLGFWFLLLLVGGVTIALRLYRLDTSFDIFVDEITYLRLGQGIAEELFPPAVFSHPFFLHPPLFFYMEAAWLLLIDLGDGVFEAVITMRRINIALAGITAITMFMIGKRIAGVWIGLAAAVIFAIDPFAVRINSRILLETAAVLFVALGYLFLIWAVSRGAEVGLRATIATGVFFGLAILTKEVSAIVTIGPLTAMLLFGYAMPRRRALTAIAIAALVYLPYPVMAGVLGHWTAFLDGKGSGILRFVGVLQTTGFSRPGSSSFMSRITELVGSLGTTYAVLAIGVGAIFILWWNGTAAERVLASWTAASYVYTGYAIVFGTLEEQAFYFAVVPAILASTVMVSRVFRPAPIVGTEMPPELAESAATSLDRSASRPRGPQVAVMIEFAVLMIASLAIWVAIHAQPDDAYSQLVQYMDDSVPGGAAIAVGATSDTAEYVLAEAYVPVKATSINALRDRDVQYVVVGSKSVEDGTVFSGIADHGEFVEARENLVALLEWLDHNAVVVFTANGRSTGTLVLYDVRDAISS